MPLALRGYVALPPHAAGDFDHGDVHLNSGRMFVAHTANNTLDATKSWWDRSQMVWPGIAAVVNCW